MTTDLWCAVSSNYTNTQPLLISKALVISAKYQACNLNNTRSNYDDQCYFCLLVQCQHFNEIRKTLDI